MIYMRQRWCERHGAPRRVASFLSLLLQGGELLLLLLLVHFFGLLGGLVVQHDEVPVGHVEAREVVSSGLGVVDVLIHHVRRASCLLCGAPATQARATGSVCATGARTRRCGTHTRIWRIAPYFPKMSNISSAVMLNGRFLWPPCEQACLLVPASTQHRCVAAPPYRT